MTSKRNNNNSSSKKKKNKIDDAELQQGLSMIESIMGSMTQNPAMLSKEFLETIFTQAQPPLNMGKESRRVKEKLLNTPEPKMKDVQHVAALCAVEAYMRAMWEIGAGTALLQVAENTDDLKMRAHCLFGIGELAMHRENREEMIERNFIHRVINLIDRDDPSQMNDLVAAMGLKALSELSFSPIGIGQVLDYNALPLFFKYLVDKEIKVPLATKTEVGVVELNTPYNLSNSALRGLYNVVCATQGTDIMDPYKNEYETKLKLIAKSKDPSAKSLALEILKVSGGGSSTSTSTGSSSKGGDDLFTFSGQDYERLFSRESNIGRCATCQKAGDSKTVLKRCSGCHSVYYCSRDCQVKDWSRHKAECKKKAAEANK